MDKYEYNLKLDQMKSRYAEEKYDEAADIADTINWNKVKNVNGLVKAGEVYEKVQRYEESREVLLMAYDSSPIGRMIIYRLAEVAVKMKDFQAAQDYYDTVALGAEVADVVHRLAGRSACSGRLRHPFLPVADRAEQQGERSGANSRFHSFRFTGSGPSGFAGLFRRVRTSTRGACSARGERMRLRE